jgi:DNA-binding transcriptional regulator YhcF (GntR family)
MKKTRTVTMTGKLLDEMRVNRHTGYRALRTLEKAGLVLVDRHPGRCPVVTISPWNSSG